MIAPEALYLLCADVLAAVEAGYTTAGVDLPERRYVANGDQQVAFDCEQVTVAHISTSTYGGNPLAAANSGQRADPAHAMRVATVAVTIVRCAPMMDANGTPPTVDAEQASAMDTYADGQLALNSLLAARKAGELGGCGNVAFLDMTTPGTAGGFASMKLRVLLGLE